MIIKVLASGSSGNCYYISDGQTELLLDAGISLKQIQIALEFRLSSIAGVFVSHIHQDHSKAVNDLVKRGIDVYAGEDVFVSKNIQSHRCKVIQPMQKNQLNTLTILPFDVQHDVPCFGFLIKSNYTGEQLLYFTDTYYLKYKFPECTHIMAEANYSKEALENNINAGNLPIEFKKRLVKTHMSIDNLLEMLNANDLSKVKQIYLLHLSENNSREEEFKREVQAVTGAEVYVC